ncbi:MAG TPA: hypothetical protein ENN67_00005 [Firmicutes bacterium]|nr:hypothetical protein [Bacillota bacterium]
MVPVDTFAPNLPNFILTLGRGIHGEIRYTYEDESAYGNKAIAEMISSDYRWTPPDSYEAIRISPAFSSDLVYADESNLPIFIVRNVGRGRAAFAAFNPFKNSPRALDPPATLLANFQLLDPYNPAREIMDNTATSFQGIQVDIIQGFFLADVRIERSLAMRFIKSVGIPVFVYLAVLPLIFIFTGRNRKLTLLLVLIWALAMTGLTKGHETARLREASILWCEALSPDEPGNHESDSSRSVSSISYTVNNPIPRSLSWNAKNVILDEYVFNAPQWQYGAVTIEEGAATKFRDVKLEMSAFPSSGSLRRLLICRRTVPDFTAVGSFELGSESVRLRLNAELPFPALQGILIFDGDDFSIRKSLGEFDSRMSLEIELFEGVDFIRTTEETENEEETEGRLIPNVGEPEPRMGNLLNLLYNTTLAYPVAAQQRYTRARLDDSPTQAFIMLGSPGFIPDITVSRGELDRKSLTIMVIAVPVVYED